MRRSVMLTALTAMLLATCLWTMEAWARAGGSRSSGSRGSRSFSAPMSPGSSPSAPGRQAVPPSGFQQTGPQRSGWMGGLMGGIGGFLLGGLIGSLLFGGFGGGLFGGIGLIEILLIAGLLYFGYSYLKRRQQPAPAASYGYTPPQDSTTGPWQYGAGSTTSATMERSEAAVDLERGLGHIRQLDHAFDAGQFAETASDIFFRIQHAWMARDMSPVRDLLTPEMYESMQKDTERLRAEHHVPHMENIAIRAVDVTEAWQESGRDYITVRVRASMIDYTVDERTNQVLEGSRSEPTRFEEYWTFVRPVGPHAWQLSAIQQAP